MFIELSAMLNNRNPFKSIFVGKSIDRKILENVKSVWIKGDGGNEI